MSITSGLSWLFFLLADNIWRPLGEAMGCLRLIPFLVIALGGWIFFILRMPETKGKTLTEIIEIFEKRAGVSVGDQAIVG